MPRYAFGAIPETETVRLTAVPLLPAAIPATCVACSESSGSNGSAAYFQVVLAGGNARATITFAVVNARFPFGYPAGIV